MTAFTPGPPKPGLPSAAAAAQIAHAPPPLPSPPPAFDSAPRRNPLMMIWSRRWYVVVALIIGLAAAIAYLWQATPIYHGVARIYVQQNGPRIMTNDPTAGMAQTQNFLYTQCELLKSFDFLSMVPDELRAGGRDISTMDTFRGEVSSIAWLSGHIATFVGKRDDIISIEIRSPYPKDAAELANAVVRAFIAYHAKESRSTQATIVDLLLKQKNKYDEELARKRAAKLEFQTKNGMLALSGAQNNPILDRLARLSQALTDIELETLNAQAAYDATKAMTSDPAKIRQLLETRQFKTETAQLRNEFRELKKRLTGLSGNYGPNFPELTSIQAAIKQLNDEMAAEDKKIVDAYLAELEQRLVTARRTQEQIGGQLNAQRAELLEYNSVSAKFELLQSELASLEKANDAIDQRIKELVVTEDGGLVPIKRVDDARPDNTPVAPARATILFEAMALGALIGCLLAIIRDLLDQRLRSVEEVKQVMSLPVLGIVPHIVARSPVQRGLQLHLDPMSDVAEAYRTIRTAVYFGVPAGVPRTLLITSPSPGDGKTTLVSNLAVAMAQAGNRVLLLDADFRRPTQHKIFELDKSVGLSSVLAGEVELKDAIKETAVNGLHILPCGPIPANPSEILNSQMFADLLETLAERYDHVLLDSPPVVPVTDARILAASCGATLLGLRAEKTTRKTALYARDVLRGVGARILGVVVNDVPRRRGLYGYYYNDSEIYQYGYGRRSGAASSAGSSGNGSGKGVSSTASPATAAAPPGNRHLQQPESARAQG